MSENEDTKQPKLNVKSMIWQYESKSGDSEENVSNLVKMHGSEMQSSFIQEKVNIQIDKAEEKFVNTQELKNSNDKMMNPIEAKQDDVSQPSPHSSTQQNPKDKKLEEKNLSKQTKEKSDCLDYPDWIKEDIEKKAYSIIIDCEQMIDNLYDHLRKSEDVRSEESDFIIDTYITKVIAKIYRIPKTENKEMQKMKQDLLLKVKNCKVYQQKLEDYKKIKENVKKMPPKSGIFTNKVESEEGDINKKHFEEVKPVCERNVSQILYEEEEELDKSVNDRNVRKLKNKDKGDRDYIGFATLPDQVHRKSVKRGFDFTLMVVGESGLGKSTLINSLFLGDLYKNRNVPEVSERISKTTTIEKKTMEIEERGVKLRLTIVDTPGFGDAVNCEDSWKVCINYIDEQFRQYFTDESGLNRRNIQDNRVHCCLYFVPPWGHSLRQMDLELMKRLHRKVNIVVVIAKADTLTTAEVQRLKKNILNDIKDNNIQMYEFPECGSDEDEDFKEQDREMKASIPFAVVGSDTTLEVAGKKVRGRQYPWGVVDVENPKHSDFVKLRTMLVSTHMQDLKDVTEDVHYENYRAQCISQISQHAFRERGKLKRDSAPYDPDISETDRLLLEKDEEIRRMQNMLRQMQEKLKDSAQDNKKHDSIIDV